MKRLDTNTRTLPDALRAIYDRRAQAVAATFNSLEYAGANRWAARTVTRIAARGVWTEPARQWLRMARNFRLSSTMGARLP